jgi:hypothetical protein
MFCPVVDNYGRFEATFILSQRINSALNLILPFEKAVIIYLSLLGAFKEYPNLPSKFVFPLYFLTPK